MAWHYKDNKQKEREKESNSRTFSCGKVRSTYLASCLFPSRVTYQDREG